MLPCDHACQARREAQFRRVAGRRSGVRELLRLGTTHGKQANIRISGRHAAPGSQDSPPPGQLNKLVKRAAMVVPAVAVAGAIVAATADHGPAAAAPSDAAGQVTAAQRADDGVKAAGRANSVQRTSRPGPVIEDRRRAPHSQVAQRRCEVGAGRCRSAPSSCQGSQVSCARHPELLGFLRDASRELRGHRQLPDRARVHPLRGGWHRGNIYQESKGNPESVGTGGGGLIGWTPLPAGFVTGNVAADLQTQLAAILTYNQQWAQYIPALNAATSATQAADIYMNYFERPGLPAAANREGAAAAVASACGF